MLQSMGSQRVGHDWATELVTEGDSLATLPRSPPAICRWEPPSYLRRRQQKQEELTTLVPPDRRGPRTGGPLRALEAAPTGSVVGAGVGPGAPGPSHSRGLQAGSGAAAASRGPGSSARESRTFDPGFGSQLWSSQQSNPGAWPPPVSWPVSWSP